MAADKTTETRAVQVPLGEVDEVGYQMRLVERGGHVDARFTPQQMETLARIKAAVQGETMANGKPVVSNANALQWLLERIRKPSIITNSGGNGKKSDEKPQNRRKKANSSA